MRHMPVQRGEKKENRHAHDSVSPSIPARSRSLAHATETMLASFFLQKKTPFLLIRVSAAACFKTPDSFVFFSGWLAQLRFATGRSMNGDALLAGEAPGNSSWRFFLVPGRFSLRCSPGLFRPELKQPAGLWKHCENVISPPPPYKTTSGKPSVFLRLDPAASTRIETNRQATEEGTSRSYQRFFSPRLQNPSSHHLSYDAPQPRPRRL